jgi:hypothetical protein
MFHVEEKGCEGERFVVGVRQLSLLRLASQLGHLERFLRLCSGDTGTLLTISVDAQYFKAK